MAPEADAKAYRQRFNQRGKNVLVDHSAWDVRRSMSWACVPRSISMSPLLLASLPCSLKIRVCPTHRPFVVLPTVVIASRAVPQKHRPTFWVGTLVFYGLVSTIMYNTDTSGDAEGGSGAPIIVVR